MALSPSSSRSSGAGGSADGWTSNSVVLAYSSADAPTFVATTASSLVGTIPVGARLKLTQTTTKYFIVTAIDATTITLYGGTDYTLINAGIADSSYSVSKAPVGFPLAPEKWTVETILTSVASKASPVASTWYGDTGLSATGPSIVVPIGSWQVFWDTTTVSNRATNGICAAAVSLSTNSAAVGDLTLTGYCATFLSAGASCSAQFQMQRQSVITLAAKAQYFLNIMTDQASQSTISLYTSTTFGRCLIRATSAYL